jgi:hypothetical protein
MLEHFNAAQLSFIAERLAGPPQKIGSSFRARNSSHVLKTPGWTLRLHNAGTMNG